MARGFLTLLLFAPALWAQTGSSYNWARQINDSSSPSTFAGLATDSAGNTWVAGTRNTVAHGKDIYFTKLDPSGNILFNTTIGGSDDDSAIALAVDSQGRAYLTGLTFSSDFPTTADAWKPTAPSTTFGERGAIFVLSLNSDGSLRWSTFFATSASTPRAIAADASGAVSLTGLTRGGLPVTPGAYQAKCACGFTTTGFLSIQFSDGFYARFDPSGSRLLAATYFGTANSYGQSLAVAPGGDVFIAASLGVNRFDAGGTALLAKSDLPVIPSLVAIHPSGDLIVAGAARTGFSPTPGAAQTDPRPLPPLPYQPYQDQLALIRTKPDLSTIAAASYFGGPYWQSALALAISGDRIYLGGYTVPRGLPTIAPLAQGFGQPATGFVAALSADLSTLLFSGYFGDTEFFGVQGLAVAPDGAVLLGGATSQSNYSPPPPGNVWINSLTVHPPPDLRIDRVASAASFLADPLSPGETIAIDGAGFDGSAQILISDRAIVPLTVSPTRLMAVTPSDLPDGAATVRIVSNAGHSNEVLVPISAASPGLYSDDQTGLGQGFILNQDGSRNSPSNPAAIGERFTIFATGVGKLTFDHGYAVTDNPVSVYVNGFYCAGVSATLGPEPGFTGDVYRLTVIVPDPQAINPDLKNFHFPPQAGVILTIAGQSSQYGLAFSLR
jgi:uncharacterized protein (TIGR03437 family)